MTHPDEARAPSDWVVRVASHIHKGGDVLDLACGSGRHTKFLLEAGHPVIALDRNLDRLGDLRRHAGVEAVETDLEAGPAWPFSGRRFAGIVVTNYLHRPLFQNLADALEDNGVLIYETFAQGNERFGRPKNPDYLLQDGELLRAFADPLYILAYEQVERSAPNPAVLQRVAAIKNPSHWH